jgi:hypothetical protein
VSGGPVRPIPHVDPEWGARVAEFCARAYAEYAAQEPSSVDQPGHALAADAALDCGLVRYALGAPPDEVRVWIARAAHALGEVFRLRGTAQAVQTVVTVEDGNLRSTASVSVDHSLTNPARGLLAIHTALVAGDRDLAQRTATLLGDPPGPHPEGPPPATDERQLAEALKALLLHRDAEAVSHAAGLADAPPPVGAEGAALGALAHRDKAAFLEALRRLLAVHAAEAGEEGNAREPRRFLSLTGLGLSALAVASGVLSTDELPRGDVYLPVEVIEQIPWSGREAADS